MVMSWRNATRLMGLIIVAVATSAFVSAEDEHLPMKGVCVLVPKDGSHVSGVIEFTQGKSGCHLTGEVTGLTPGEHGFHIHEFGDIRDPKGLSTGGHFNPEGHMHGGLKASERHAGDMGNITANDKGVAKVDVMVAGLQLHFVLGRAIVVHGKPDDLKTQPTGNAGPRVAVGVIAIAAPPK